MDLINRIILEEVNKFIISETDHVKQKHERRNGVKDDYGKSKKNPNKKYSDEEYRRISHLIKKIRKANPELSKREAVQAAIDAFKDEKEKEYIRRTRKKKGGGKEVYNGIDYERKNKKSSTSDSIQIADRIDQEKTDIAAVAREIFPNHTDEGAQSQLRKILNGERPMTANVASKLEDMMSSGQLAVKG